MKLSVPIFLAGAFLAVLASCATTPKPATQSTTPAPQAQSAAPPAAAQPSSPAAKLKQAQDLKALIDQYNLASQAADTYQAGSAALLAGQQAMGSDNATANAKLDEAIGDFNRVIQSGFPPLIQARQQQVDKAKAAALAVKADTAVPDQYNQAVALEQQAAQKQSSGDYAGAYELLAQALDAYNNAANSATQQRAQALQALSAANAQIDQTTTQAQALQKSLQSEPTAGGGTQ